MGIKKNYRQNWVCPMATSLSKSHHLITLKDPYVNSKRFVNVKKKKKIHINYTFTLKVDAKVRNTLKCEQLNNTLFFKFQTQYQLPKQGLA